jgi:hypothetical protein
MKLAAANHLLSIPAGPAYYDTWYRLVEIKNESLIRKAIPWIRKSKEQSDNRSAHSTRIGDIMNELGMETEAIQWWKSFMDLDPSNREYVDCTLRVASTMKPSAAQNFLKNRAAADTDHHGAYASELANLLFRADDLDGMQSLLKKARDRADRTPFRSWGMSEWPARSWLETAKSSKDWPDDKKKRVYTIIRDLRIGRVSSEAGLDLLSTSTRSTDRLLSAQALIKTADQHYESWRRIYPYAQAALARKDFPLGATILNGLLNTIRSVGNSEITEARKLLGKAYREMGTLSADISADSPIAPLLQIILHLRLGDNERAEASYYQNQELFNKHRHDLPIELLLFGAEIHIAQGTPEDHDRAEDILRGWMLKFSESEKVRYSRQVTNSASSST